MFENFRERDIKSVSINNDKLLPFVKAKPWYDRYLFLEFFEKKMYMTFLNVIRFLVVRKFNGINKFENFRSKNLVLKRQF